MIKVLATYADNAGCGDYRVRLPAAAVNAKAGEHGVTVTTADHFEADATFVNGKYVIRHVALPKDTEVVAVQRPVHAAMAGVLAWLKSQRPDVGIVVELDDDLLAVPTSNIAYSRINRKSNALENSDWLRMAMRHADVLTVSTPELARRYGHGVPTFVVRNGVPAAMLGLPSRAIGRKRTSDQHGDRVIGWAGYSGTHGGDLEVTSGALAEFINPMGERSVTFRNIGPKDGVAKALDVADDQVEASGWLPIDMYRVAMSELDIGIVPLADTRFNRCKSNLKALEMAAAGSLVIASALPEFEDLQRSGMPILLARDRRKHWSGALTRALSMTDGELREFAQSGREYIKRYATVDARAYEWANAWKTAAQIARSRTQTARRAETYDRV